MYGIRKGVSAANPIAEATALDDVANFPNPRLFFMTPSELGTQRAAHAYDSRLIGNAVATMVGREWCLGGATRSG